MYGTPDRNPSTKDRDYRLQGKRNLIDAGVSLNANLRRVVQENKAAMERDIATARCQDRAVIALMRDLIESVQLQRLRHAVDLPDHLAEIMLSREELERLRAVKARQARGGAANAAGDGDALGTANSAAQSLIGVALNIRSDIDFNRKRSDVDSTYTTNFIGAGNALAVQYAEGKLEEWLKIWVGERVANLQKSARDAVSTADTLAKLAQLGEKLPPSAAHAIGYVVHPASGVLTAIEDAAGRIGFVDNFQKAASHVNTGIVIPLTKLAEPIGNLVLTASKYQKIDAMHALHQRRRGCGAAYEIADKWEQDLFNAVANGHQIYAFICALRNLWSAVRAFNGSPTSQAGLAEKLWVAAQTSAPGIRGDCDDALVILATLFGAGDAPKGVAKAVAAIVSPRQSGIEKINCLI